MFDNYESALDYLYARPRGRKEASLANMQALLKQLGDPQNQLPDVIHVTGTNGKGSVSTMVAGILSHSGYRVGLYTSPYMVDFRERIQISGEMISEASFVACMNRVVAASAQLPKLDFLFFELLTAVMMVYFSESQLDYAVIEVGIGGLFDASNVLETAKIAVITTVALDHTDFLGTTIEEVTRHKAGIIHPGMQVVVGNLPDISKTIIQTYSSSPLIESKIGQFRTRLKGSYQADNVATAVAVIRTLLPDISDQLIQSALDQVVFPGRYEFFLYQGRVVILDGAHNQAGMRALLEAVEADKQPVTVLFASLADKNASLALADFAASEWVEGIYLTQFQTPHARRVDQQGRSSYHFFEDYRAAFSKLKVERLLVAGSLYFISEVRQWLLAHGAQVQ